MNVKTVVRAALAVALLALAAGAVHAQSNDDKGAYLGNLSANPYGSNSTANPYSQAGCRSRGLLPELVAGERLAPGKMSYTFRSAPPVPGAAGAR